MSKRKRPRKHTKSEAKDYTPLAGHQRKGSKLTPPLATIPKLKTMSWTNDRLPEMLWATLLVSSLPRERALATFRALASYIAEYENGEKPHDITHSGLARTQPPILASMLAYLMASAPDIRGALRPLLLFESLPARDHWAQAISLEPAPDDWNALATAVSRTLFHQSQEATDCRWLRLICLGAADKLALPTQEIANELNRYPSHGDMREVRPTIRSTEGAVASMFELDPKWASGFWAECLDKTPCVLLPAGTDQVAPQAGTTRQRVVEVYGLLAQHALDTTTTTAVDPAHDTSFGLALYSLALLEQLLRIGVSNTVIARTGLRTLVEVYITLAYLSWRSDPAAWSSFRVYGAGQAKLAYLKLDDVPLRANYVDVQTLKDLANEDLWQEFLSIDLGHWQNANLRQLSIDSGTKPIYDKYYPWASAIAHGLWGPVRDVVFDTCGNPLHRLHRIPRPQPRSLPDLVPDACEVVDLTLDLLSKLFPTFSHGVSMVP